MTSNLGAKAQQFSDERGVIVREIRNLLSLSARDGEPAPVEVVVAPQGRGRRRRTFKLPHTVSRNVSGRISAKPTSDGRVVITVGETNWDPRSVCDNLGAVAMQSQARELTVRSWLIGRVAFTATRKRAKTLSWRVSHDADAAEAVVADDTSADPVFEAALRGAPAQDAFFARQAADGHGVGLDERGRVTHARDKAR